MLALLFCSGALAACEGAGGVSEDSGAPSEQTHKRFDGATLRILGKNPDHGPSEAARQWIGDEETKGNLIGEVAGARRDWLLEEYGITIQYTPCDAEEYYITEEVNRQMLSGLNEYDLYVDGQYAMSQIARDGYLKDLRSLPYIDLNNEWYDRYCIENLSVGGKVHYVAGDALITDDENVYCILFNKDLYEEQGYAGMFDGRSLYDLVDDGDWTYDAMLRICKESYSDRNGNGRTDPEDGFGLIIDNGCVQVLMAGGGYEMSSKNEDDFPELTVFNEKAASLFAQVDRITNEKAFVLNSDRIGTTSPYGDVEKNFGDGLTTFYMTKLNSLSELRKYPDLRFGVLPVPKASAAQEVYCNSAAPLHFSAIGIPLNIAGEELEMTCAALEALGWYGREYLTPAYVETTLKLKRVEAPEDAAMIDLILNNRVFDAATVYNWGGMLSFFNQFALTQSRDFASAWETVANKTMAEMQETIDKFTK